MKNLKKILLYCLVALLLGGLSLDSFAQVAAKKSKQVYKMTTAIPVGIATPDKVQTSIGTLHLVDGIPTKETTQIVFDNLDLQRSTSAMLSTIQIASMEAMRAGLLTFGPANQTVMIFADLMSSKSLWLTPNKSSVYMTTWLELTDEPMVIETPPNVLGIIDNAWFRYVTDFGNVGPDKGKGGKFLMLPPNYKGEVPEGYYVIRTDTYGNWMIWRGFTVDGSTEVAVNETKAKFKIYPLSQKDNQPKMNFINISDKPQCTIHSMDYAFWKEVNSTIQRETLIGLDPEIRGLLASIGIEKGKEFNPDERMKKILTNAANIGAVTARAVTAYPRDKRLYVYEGQRQWATVFIDGRYDFLLNGASLLDSRIAMYFYATGITPAMSMKIIGKGSQYLMSYVDENKKSLDGSKTYKVHLPANVPAKDFWSFMLYDTQTRSMLQTDQYAPGVDSGKKGLKQNSDGSYDIFFAPQPPKGFENNWVQTIPNKSFSVIFRLYGPLESFFDKTWKPSDLVAVD